MSVACGHRRIKPRPRSSARRKSSPAICKRALSKATARTDGRRGREFANNRPPAVIPLLAAMLARSAPSCSVWSRPMETMRSRPTTTFVASRRPRDPLRPRPHRALRDEGSNPPRSPSRSRSRPRPDRPHQGLPQPPRLLRAFLGAHRVLIGHGCTVHDDSFIDAAGGGRGFANPQALGPKHGRDGGAPRSWSRRHAL